MDHNQVAADWAAENPEAAAVLRTEGAAGERDRIAAVRAQSLPGHEGLIEKLAADGQTTGPEAAVQVIAADRVRQQGIAQARLNDAIDAVPQAAAPVLEEAASGSRLGANGVIDAKTDAAALDAAAKAYQAANPGTDYLSAVKAVQFPNGGN
jgi:hypothetical protein